MALTISFDWFLVLSTFPEAFLSLRENLIIFVSRLPTALEGNAVPTVIAMDTKLVPIASGKSWS